MSTHRIKKRKFGTTSHRRAMFRNMACSFLNDRKDGSYMKTTLTKAKEFRGVMEPLITLAKVDSVHTRRLAFSRLRDNNAVARLFVIAEAMINTPGGYLRVLKHGYRSGDSAPMAVVLLSKDGAGL